MATILNTTPGTWRNLLVEDQPVPGVLISCYRASATGLKFRARLQGDGHKTYHIVFTVSYAKPFARIFSFNTHLILRSWFYCHQPTHFIWKERRLRDIQVTVQDHSVTKQHLDSNHTFNPIPHMLKHHSTMSCFFILRDKAKLSVSNKTIRFSLCLSRLPF